MIFTRFGLQTQEEIEEVPAWNNVIQMGIQVKALL